MGWNTAKISSDLWEGYVACTIRVTNSGKFVWIPLDDPNTEHSLDIRAGCTVDRSESNNRINLVTPTQTVVVAFDNEKQVIIWAATIAGVREVQMELETEKQGRRVERIGGINFELDSRYQSVEFLSKASSGYVVSAVDNQTNTRVVIKKFQGALKDRAWSTRIFQELQVLGLLKHPNILELLDIPVPNSASDFEDVYFATPLMETDLARVIRSSRQRLRLPHFKTVLYQLFCALNYLHSGGILHRDLRPANLLANKDGLLKLCNFGLCCGLDGAPMPLLDAAAAHDGALGRSPPPLSPRPGGGGGSGGGAATAGGSGNGSSDGSGGGFSSGMVGGGGGEAGTPLLSAGPISGGVAGGGVGSGGVGASSVAALGTTFGVCWYRSPEALLGFDGHGPGLDMWAAGCIAAEMVLRAPLLQGRTPLDQLALILATLGPPTPQQLSYLPPHSAAARFMATQLQQLQQQEQQEQQQQQRQRRRQRRQRRPSLAELLPRDCDGDMRDLILRLLVFDPRERLSAAQALDHPLFEGMREERQESRAPFRYRFEFARSELSRPQLRQLLHAQAVAHGEKQQRRAQRAQRKRERSEKRRKRRERRRANGEKRGGSGSGSGGSGGSGAEDAAAASGVGGDSGGDDDSGGEQSRERAPRKAQRGEEKAAPGADGNRSRHSRGRSRSRSRRRSHHRDRHSRSDGKEDISTTEAGDAAAGHAAVAAASGPTRSLTIICGNGGSGDGDGDDASSGGKGDASGDTTGDASGDTTGDGDDDDASVEGTRSRWQKRHDKGSAIAAASAAASRGGSRNQGVGGFAASPAPAASPTFRVAPRALARSSRSLNPSSFERSPQPGGGGGGGGGVVPSLSPIKVPTADGGDGGNGLGSFHAPQRDGEDMLNDARWRSRQQLMRRADSTTALHTLLMGGGGGGSGGAPSPRIAGAAMGSPLGSSRGGGGGRVGAFYYTPPMQAAGSPVHGSPRPSAHAASSPSLLPPLRGASSRRATAGGFASTTGGGGSGQSPVPRSRNALRHSSSHHRQQQQQQQQQHGYSHFQSRHGAASSRPAPAPAPAYSPTPAYSPAAAQRRRRQAAGGAGQRVLALCVPQYNLRK